MFFKILKIWFQNSSNFADVLFGDGQNLTVSIQESVKFTHFAELYLRNFKDITLQLGHFTKGIFPAVYLNSRTLL